jgi:hypothetical protein
VESVDSLAAVAAAVDASLIVADAFYGKKFPIPWSPSLQITLYGRTISLEVRVALGRGAEIERGAVLFHAPAKFGAILSFFDAVRRPPPFEGFARIIHLQRKRPSLVFADVSVGLGPCRASWDGNECQDADNCHAASLKNVCAAHF